MTYVYRAEIHFPEDIPLEVLHEAIDERVRSLAATTKDEVVITIQKEGESASPIPGFTLPLVSGPPAPERKILVADLSDDLQYLVEWATKKLVEEGRRQRGWTTSISGRHPAGVLYNKEESPVSTHFQEPVEQPGRKHPFEGPEVFDDKAPRREIGDAYPRLSELFADKRRAPEDEGEWQLPQGEDHVGEDK